MSKTEKTTENIPVTPKKPVGRPSKKAEKVQKAEKKVEKVQKSEKAQKCLSRFDNLKLQLCDSKVLVADLRKQLSQRAYQAADAQAKINKLTVEAAQLQLDAQKKAIQEELGGHIQAAQDSQIESITFQHKLNKNYGITMSECQYDPESGMLVDKEGCPIYTGD